MIINSIDINKMNNRLSSYLNTSLNTKIPQQYVFLHLNEEIYNICSHYDIVLILLRLALNTNQSFNTHFNCTI